MGTQVCLDGLELQVLQECLASRVKLVRLDLMEDQEFLDCLGKKENLGLQDFREIQ
jgi:hypothetical protein